MLILCLPFYVISGSFIERTTWEGFALATGLLASSKLEAQWLVSFYMYFDVIVVPDEPPLPVVRFTDDFWLQFTAWVAINGTGGENPCAFVEGYP